MFMCSLFILNVSLMIPTISVAQENISTFIKQTRGDIGFYLDIREVDLSESLVQKSSHDKGIVIYRCVSETDECHPITEFVTYEELRDVLISHNLVYIVGGTAVAVSTVVLLVKAPWVLAGAVGVGGVATIFGGTFGSAIGGPFGGAAGGAIAALAAGAVVALPGPGLVVAGVLGAGMGGGLTEMSYDGRQMPPGLLLKDGSFLRKLFSDRENLYVRNLAVVQEELTELVDTIVRYRGLW